MTLESAVGPGISGIREKGVRPFSPFVILNLFQDNKPRLRVIPKQVRDDEGGERLAQFPDDEGGGGLTQVRDDENGN